MEKSLSGLLTSLNSIPSWQDATKQILQRMEVMKRDLQLPLSLFWGPETSVDPNMKFYCVFSQALLIKNSSAEPLIGGAWKLGKVKSMLVLLRILF